MLPLVLADEASEDTRRLVGAHLEKDPALAIFATLLFVAFGFDDEGIYRLWRNSPEIGFPVFVVAALLWMAFLNVTYRLKR